MFILFLCWFAEMSMELPVGKTRSYLSSWSSLLYSPVLLQSTVMLTLCSRKARIALFLDASYVATKQDSLVIILFELTRIGSECYYSEQMNRIYYYLGCCIIMKSGWILRLQLSSMVQSSKHSVLSFLQMKSTTRSESMYKQDVEWKILKKGTNQDIVAHPYTYTQNEEEPTFWTKWSCLTIQNYYDVMVLHLLCRLGYWAGATSRGCQRLGGSSLSWIQKNISFRICLGVFFSQKQSRLLGIS